MRGTAHFSFIFLFGYFSNKFKYINPSPLLMTFELEEYHHGIKDDELIADLRRVASELKKDSVTHFEYQDKGKYGVNTYLRRFGSWLKSLERAGLKKTINMNTNEEELFQNLEEVWTKIGRQPHYGEMMAPLSKFHRGTYERRYGTWRKALEKFVQYINSEEKQIPKEKIEGSNKLSTQHKTKRGINWRLRFIVMKRDSFKCKMCGKSPATDSSIILHVDHIIPYSKGGETIPENLQTLCSKCNIGKSNLDN
jgi:hypothetical protein